MRFRDEDGQLLVVTAISMIGLMGFVALAIDVGLLFRARRNMQIVADAGAMAGAVELYYERGGQVSSSAAVSAASSAALLAAKTNGVDSTVTGNSVLVSIPPVDGPNTSCSTCVEVRVGSPAQTFFAGLLTHANSMTVAARAVAGAPIASDACIWIMKATGSDTLHLQGNSAIDATGCSIYVNSSDSAAVKLTGKSSSFNGPEFDIVGGYTGSLQSGSTSITSGVAAETPPISNLSNPTCTIPDSSTTSISGTYTPSSGTIAADSVVCFSNAITLKNGASLTGALGDGVVYEFANGVTVATGATVNVGSATYDSTTKTFTSTAGAVIDLSGGTLTQNSNSVLNMYAPTSGTYNSVAIMQPTTNSTTPLQVQFGSNNEVLDGIIYAPGVEVYLQDNGGGITASGVIAGTMYLKSSNITIPNYSNANPTTTPFKKLTMLE
ncbi:MAG TPA: Tad domain-containing protein [Terracidiphilus sp.]|nr:Tad domain-containing protein [Terracidiphilus sp.]